MRLTVDIIRRAPQITNTLHQREIDLRGLGLTILEERPLLLLLDSFDVLNLAQNPLTRLEYFPTGGVGFGVNGMGFARRAAGGMKRLHTLVVHRNQIAHVSVATCAAVLPNLRAFLADHNAFASLQDLLFLSHWTQLEILSLEHNPVSEHEEDVRLRAFVLFLCPKLKLVNYQRITQADRQHLGEVRAEFEEMVKEWRNAAATGGLPHTNLNTETKVNNLDNTARKLRKRGRDARAAAVTNPTAAPSIAVSGGGEKTSTAPTKGSRGLYAAGITVGQTEVAETVNTHARLKALEERMAAAETEEELCEIQQEIMELEAVAKQQAKAR